MHNNVTAMPGYGLATGYGMSDDVLAKSAAAGDSAAFGELYSRHVERVREHVGRWAGCRTGAEDLVQEVFTAALAEIKGGRFRPSWTPEGFGEWLTGTVAAAVRQDDNAAYWADFKAAHVATLATAAEHHDGVRAARAGSSAPASPAESVREHLAVEAERDASRAAMLAALADVASDDLAASIRAALADENGADEEAVRESVRAALAALSPDLRRVLELRILDGADGSTAAAELGIDRRAVSKLRAKAVERMRGVPERKTGRTPGTGCVVPLKPAAGPSDAVRKLADDVARRIEAGEFGQPGAQLPGTRQLAAALGTTRMPLQHALTCLASRGVVYSVPSRGYFIADPSQPRPPAPAAGPARPKWGGYVHMPDSTGTVRRRWVYGPTAEAVQVKLDALRAELALAA